MHISSTRASTDERRLDVGSSCARASDRVVTILAGKVFDPYTLSFQPNQVIRVSQDSGLILSVKAHTEDELTELRERANADELVDLSCATVLAGLVDTHVHPRKGLFQRPILTYDSAPTVAVFLHPYAETSWNDQLTKESIVERTVRAVNHARETLLAGYTTVRDLGTEGAGDADIVLRRCISGANLIPGPRFFCANRAIVPTGAYGPKGSLNLNTEGVEGVTGAEVADGVDQCRAAVRRQVGAGADWIKIYADYRYRSRMQDVSPRTAAESIVTFHRDELKAMIDTAHALGVKVAAHASTASAVRDVVDLGVDTIEHGTYVDDPKVFEEMAKKGVIWNPTLSVVFTNSQDRWMQGSDAFKLGLKSGVKIACGGDTGPFPHGENALEMQLMAKLGAPPMEILRWATLGGWECVRSLQWEGDIGEKRLQRVGELRETREEVGENDMPFGAIRTGFAADIIATNGDLENDFENAVAAKSIKFVMKLGNIYKREGRSV